MSAGKNLLRRAVALAIESTGYNNGGTIALPGDAFHVHEDFEVEPQYQFNGERTGTAAGTSMQQREQKWGRFTEVEFAHRVRTPGAAYSSSAVPTVDRLLRAHGMSKTLVPTGGSESITYKAVTDPGTWESLFGDLYTGKEKQSITGGYVSKWTHKAEGVGLTEWRFTVRAPLGLPTDSALPTITAYPNASVSHIKAAGSSLTIQAATGAAFQGLVRESTVTSERSIEDRQSQAPSSGLHVGFQLGPYTQTIECLVEATSLTGSPYSTSSLLDPYRMVDEATLCTALLGFTYSGQYKRVKFNSSASAQIVEAKKERAGAIRLWRLTIQCNPTSEVADDGLSVLFD